MKKNIATPNLSTEGTPNTMSNLAVHYSSATDGWATPRHNYQLRYFDVAAGRWRTSDGRFVKMEAEETNMEADEICPSGCQRFGNWWAAEDCPLHLGMY